MSVKKVDILNVESRWRLAGVCAATIFFLTYFGDIQSMQSEVNSLRSDVNDVAEQININKSNALSADALPASQHQQIDVSELLKFIDDKQAMLQSGENGANYKLELDINHMGIFMQLLDLLQAYGDKYRIESFSLTENAGSSFHAMLALIVADSQQQRNTFSVTEIKPLSFCSGNNLKQILPDQSQHYRLTDLQLLGTMQGQHGLGVLIRFPNGVMRTMHLHDHLGLEGGEITAITARFITVKSLDNHLTRLTLKQ